MYYAVEYSYGKYILNGWPISDEGGGNRADHIHRFKTKRERDSYVDAGTPYYTESGYRETLPSKHRAVQRVLRAPDYFRQEEE